jgi:hypothetical protein
MMNKRTVLAIAAACLGVLFYASCTKSCTKLSFTQSTMKPWFDKYCLSCHGTGKSNASEWKYDPEDYTCTIKNNIDNIYNQVYVNKKMPPSSVTAADLAAFKAWYDAGAPAQ